jgi:hypothetical protein
LNEQDRPRPQALADRNELKKGALLTAKTPTIARNPPAQAEKAPVPLTPDMFHVTSIALGDIPLAIVNAKRVAEGDWLRMTVGGKEISVQVLTIEDGLVHFGYGDQVIAAHLSPAISKTPGKQ